MADADPPSAKRYKHVVDHIKEMNLDGDVVVKTHYVSYLLGDLVMENILRFTAADDLLNIVRDKEINTPDAQMFKDDAEKELAKRTKIALEIYYSPEFELSDFYNVFVDNVPYTKSISDKKLLLLTQDKGHGYKNFLNYVIGKPELISFNTSRVLPERASFFEPLGRRQSIRALEPSWLQVRQAINQITDLVVANTLSLYPANFMETLGPNIERLYFFQGNVCFIRHGTMWNTFKNLERLVVISPNRQDNINMLRVASYSYQTLKELYLKPDGVYERDMSDGVYAERAVRSCTKLTNITLHINDLNVNSIINIINTQWRDRGANIVTLKLYTMHESLSWQNFVDFVNARPNLINISIPNAQFLSADLFLSIEPKIRHLEISHADKRQISSDVWIAFFNQQPNLVSVDATDCLGLDKDAKDYRKSSGI